MQETYDVVEHLRRWKWMLGCFGCVVGFWIACWVLSPEGAVCGMLANLYLGFAFWHLIHLYPTRKEDEASLRFLHSRRSHEEE